VIRQRSPTIAARVSEPDRPRANEAGRGDDGYVDVAQAVPSAPDDEVPAGAHDRFRGAGSWDAVG